MNVTAIGPVGCCGVAVWIRGCSMATHSKRFSCNAVLGLSWYCLESFSSPTVGGKKSALCAKWRGFFFFNRELVCFFLLPQLLFLYIIDNKRIIHIKHKVKRTMCVCVCVSPFSFAAASYATGGFVWRRQFERSINERASARHSAPCCLYAPVSWSNDTCYL